MGRKIEPVIEKRITMSNGKRVKALVPNPDYPREKAHKEMIAIMKRLIKRQESMKHSLSPA